MMKIQSRPCATKLVGLVIATSVTLGVVGCSTEHTTTTSGPSSAGEASSSVAAQGLVDVEKVWATHPMPPCPRVIVGNVSAPAGLELPSDETVAKQLAGVRSPGSESWVRTKLGWLTQELAATRADIISDPGVGAKEQSEMFAQWVTHIGEELRQGRDTPSDLDGVYPEECS